MVIIPSLETGRMKVSAALLLCLMLPVAKTAAAAADCRTDARVQLQLEVYSTELEGDPVLRFELSDDGCLRSERGTMLRQAGKRSGVLPPPVRNRLSLLLRDPALQGLDTVRLRAELDRLEQTHRARKDGSLELAVPCGDVYRFRFHESGAVRELQVMGLREYAAHYAEHAGLRALDEVVDLLHARAKVHYEEQP